MTRFTVFGGVIAGIVLLAVVAFQSRIVEKFFVSTSILPIYIVSLASRKEDRLDPLLRSLNVRGEGGTNYYVRSIVGVDGQAQVVEAFQLSKGQIGCWLSHAKIWKSIAKEQSEPYALVLEDDALVEMPKTYLKIKEILGELNLSWDVCYLGGHFVDKSNVQRVSKSLSFSPTSRMWHSHAYLISREGAAKLLKMSDAFNESTKMSAFAQVMPVDDWMTDPERGLKIFMTDPELIPFIRDSISDTIS